MLKLLISALVIYGYYKFFIAPKRISTRKKQELEDKKREQEEYTDYEEIE